MNVGPASADGHVHTTDAVFVLMLLLFCDVCQVANRPTELHVGFRLRDDAAGYSAEIRARAGWVIPFPKFLLKAST